MENNKYNLFRIWLLEKVNESEKKGVYALDSEIVKTWINVYDELINPKSKKDEKN